MQALVVHASRSSARRELPEPFSLFRVTAIEIIAKLTHFR